VSLISCVELTFQVFSRKAHCDKSHIFFTSMRKSFLSEAPLNVSLKSPCFQQELNKRAIKTKKIYMFFFIKNLFKK
jgi:hypothetical protein